MGEPFDDEYAPAPPPVLPGTPNLLDPVVNVPLALDTIIGQDYQGVPITLGQQVAAIMAERLLVDAGREWYPNVAGKANEIAERLVAEKFADVLDREIIPTDQYGTAKGEPTTIADLVSKKAEGWLGEKASKQPSNAGYGSGYVTNLQAQITAVLDRKFEAEVTKVVKEARAAAMKTVADKAAKLFTEALAKEPLTLG